MFHSASSVVRTVICLSVYLSTFSITRKAISTSRALTVVLFCVTPTLKILSRSKIIQGCSCSIPKTTKWHQYLQFERKDNSEKKKKKIAKMMLTALFYLLLLECFRKARPNYLLHTWKVNFKDCKEMIIKRKPMARILRQPRKTRATVKYKLGDVCGNQSSYQILKWDNVRQLLCLTYSKATRSSFVSWSVQKQAF